MSGYYIRHYLSPTSLFLLHKLHNLIPIFRGRYYFDSSIMIILFSFKVSHVI